MSEVSGVIICFSCSEEEEHDDGPPINMAPVNAWLARHANGQELTRLEEHFGGCKHPQMYALGGGINSLDEDDFAEFVLQLDWEYPGNLVLVIQPEEGATRVFQGEGDAA